MKPAFLNEVCTSGVLDKYDFSSVEEISTGGAQVLPEITKKVNATLKNGEATQGYGM